MTSQDPPEGADPAAETLVEPYKGGPELIRLTISPAEAGKRLDIVVSNHRPDVSRWAVAKMIRLGLAGVDGRPAKPATKVREGQVVVMPSPQRKVSLAPEAIPLDAVYEDEYIAVINKQPGLVVHPGKGNFSGTLVNALAHRYGVMPASSEKSAMVRPGLVHRLDKDTSGLMAVARTLPALLAMTRMMEARKIKRSYLALVKGKPESRTGLVDAPIGPGRIDKVRREIRSYGGKPASTEFEVLESYPGGSLLRLKLRTGRTHQIRVHMAYIGHPVLGDSVYGEKGGYPRQMLHAAQLAFKHPMTGKELALEAPLPADFQKVLEGLRG